MTPGDIQDTVELLNAAEGLNLMSLNTLARTTEHDHVHQRLLRNSQQYLCMPQKASTQKLDPDMQVS